MKVGDLVVHRGQAQIGIIIWLNPHIKDNLYEHAEVYIPQLRSKVFWECFDLEVL